MNIWKTLCIICIIIIVYLMFEKMTNNRNVLKGIWTATNQFCSDSSISSMMIKFNDNLKSGNIVMISNDNKSLLCNTSFSIKGWSIIPPSNKNKFIENIRLDFDESSPIPTKCILEYKNGTLYLRTSEKLYAELVKLGL